MVTPSGGWLLPVRWRMPCSSGAKYDPSKNDVSWFRPVVSCLAARGCCLVPDAATRGLPCVAGGAGLSCRSRSGDCTAVAEPSRAGMCCSLLSSRLSRDPPPPPYICSEKQWNRCDAGASNRFVGQLVSSSARVYPDPERYCRRFFVFAQPIQHFALQCRFIAAWKVFQCCMTVKSQVNYW